MLTITPSPTSLDRFSAYAVRDESTGRIIADRLTEAEAMDRRDWGKALDLKALRSALSTYECRKEQAEFTTTMADIRAQDEAYVALVDAARRLGYRGSVIGVVAWAQNRIAASCV